MIQASGMIVTECVAICFDSFVSSFPPGGGENQLFNKNTSIVGLLDVSKG